MAMELEERDALAGASDQLRNMLMMLGGNTSDSSEPEERPKPRKRRSRQRRAEGEKNASDGEKGRSQSGATAKGSAMDQRSSSGAISPRPGTPAADGMKSPRVRPDSLRRLENQDRKLSRGSSEFFQDGLLESFVKLELLEEQLDVDIETNRAMERTLSARTLSARTRRVSDDFFSSPQEDGTPRKVSNASSVSDDERAKSPSHKRTRSDGGRPKVQRTRSSDQVPTLNLANTQQQGGTVKKILFSPRQWLQGGATAAATTSPPPEEEASRSLSGSGENSSRQKLPKWLKRRKSRDKSKKERSTSFKKLDGKERGHVRVLLEDEVVASQVVPVDRSTTAMDVVMKIFRSVRHLTAGTDGSLPPSPKSGSPRSSEERCDDTYWLFVCEGAKVKARLQPDQLMWSYTTQHDVESVHLLKTNKSHTDVPWKRTILRLVLLERRCHELEESLLLAADAGGLSSHGSARDSTMGDSARGDSAADSTLGDSARGSVREVLSVGNSEEDVLEEQCASSDEDDPGTFPVVPKSPERPLTGSHSHCSQLGRSKSDQMPKTGVSVPKREASSSSALSGFGNLIGRAKSPPMSNDDATTMKVEFSEGKILKGRTLAQRGGSNAKVYTACVDGWGCVMKEVVVEHKSDAEAIANEISILSSLPAHPNVVRILFHQRIDNVVRLFMQKYDLTVREYVQQKKAAGLKALSFDSIARVLVGSLQGLTFLAKRNVIHRDIKAENLFLMLDERDEIQSVVVGDFDTAKVISKRNQPTTVRGTPSFIAPEVLLSEDTIAYSSKADIYSFGMLMYELLSMDLPFSDCRGAAQISSRVLAGKVPVLRGDLGAELQPFVPLYQSCTLTDAKSRPSAKSLLKKIKQILQEHESKHAK